jgi:hypothetical protein
MLCTCYFKKTTHLISAILRLGLKKQEMSDHLFFKVPQALSIVLVR